MRDDAHVQKLDIFLGAVLALFYHSCKRIKKKIQMSLCDNCHSGKLLETTHNSDYNNLLLKMQAMIEQLGKEHEKGAQLRIDRTTFLQAQIKQLQEREKVHKKEAQLRIESETTSKQNIDPDFLRAQIKHLQECLSARGPEATIRQPQLSETQPERKTELGHDITRRTAEYLEGSDLRALRETSKDGESAVTSLGPCQPYLQRCATPRVFGVLPSELSRFTEGCEHLWKNILGLFSDVIVMAKKSNDGEEYVINMVKFDIQDHTNNPKTIFTYPPDTEIPFQVFTWDTVEKKFSVIPHRQKMGGLNEDELVTAIQAHWAVRLPPSHYTVTQDSRAKNGFWAPVIEFQLNHPEPSAEIIRMMDQKMETALNQAGTLARSYRFITKHTLTSRYALFHQGILKKRGNALLQVRPWTVVPTPLPL